MFLHETGNPARISTEEFNMAQLFHLVGPDECGSEEFGNIRQVGCACRHETQPRAGKCNFGCRAEKIDPVGVPCFLACAQQIFRLLGIVNKMMNDIGVVGKNCKVRRGCFHGGQSFHGVVGNRVSGGIGISGNENNSLDACIRCGHFFNFVHIRPIFRHSDRDHLESHFSKERKMPVIAGHGDNHLRLIGFAPGRGASDHTAQESPHQNLGEDEQAGIVADHHFFRFHA